ncbi:type II secretion system protein N [Azonexus sp. IMCC34839]|uniref:type II secretion system protein N n=1 Tax=Azonexus sp. IMCC34839 TaxID=3133695 RepID=UPI003999D5FD
MLALPKLKLSELIGRLFMLFVTAVGVWIVATLLWGFSSPRAAPYRLVSESPSAIAERLASRRLMGGTSQAAGGTNERIGDMLLIGLLAADKASQSRAIIRQDGEPLPRVVSVGDTLAGALSVRAIDRDGVELSSGARLALPRPQSLQPTETPVEKD